MNFEVDCMLCTSSTKTFFRKHQKVSHGIFLSQYFLFFFYVSWKYNINHHDLCLSRYFLQLVMQNRLSNKQYKQRYKIKNLKCLSNINDIIFKILLPEKSKLLNNSLNKNDQNSQKCRYMVCIKICCSDSSKK